MQMFRAPPERIALRFELFRGGIGGEVERVGGGGFLGVMARIEVVIGKVECMGVLGIALGRMSDICLERNLCMLQILF